MMKCDGQTGPEREVEELVASLHRLLEAQLAAGREGDFARVERLGEQANAVVEAIVRRGVNVRTDVHGGRDLERLYSELTLLLRAQQADIQDKLRQLRRVKRVVGVYGGNDKVARKSPSQLG
jgi:hypothetical protein